jgi:predicted CopG family antitoxin
MGLNYLTYLKKEKYSLEIYEVREFDDDGLGDLLAYQSKGHHSASEFVKCLIAEYGNLDDLFGTDSVEEVESWVHNRWKRNVPYGDGIMQLNAVFGQGAYPVTEIEM